MYDCISWINRYYKMNDQICIVNQETLNQLITFERAYEVKNNGR